MIEAVFFRFGVNNYIIRPGTGIERKSLACVSLHSKAYIWTRDSQLYSTRHYPELVAEVVGTIPSGLGNGSGA